MLIGKTLHGMCLSSSCLTICKNCSMKTQSHLVDHRINSRHIPDFLLTSIGTNNGIETEVSMATILLESDGTINAFLQFHSAGFICFTSFPLQHRSQSYANLYCRYWTIYQLGFYGLGILIWTFTTFMIFIIDCYICYILKRYSFKCCLCCFIFHLSDLSIFFIFFFILFRIRNPNFPSLKL
eukprot:symbB.v1.2.041317.t1/scaffold8051.1/size7993/2